MTEKQHIFTRTNKTKMPYFQNDDSIFDDIASLAVSNAKPSIFSPKQKHQINICQNKEL